MSLFALEELVHLLLIDFAFVSQEFQFAHDAQLRGEVRLDIGQETKVTKGLDYLIQGSQNQFLGLYAYL